MSNASANDTISEIRERNAARLKELEIELRMSVNETSREIVRFLLALMIFIWLSWSGLPWVYSVLQLFQK